jgi:enolase
VKITRLSGLEILDSRGRPTVRATCTLESGAIGIASAPSGASTGKAEAHELRDEDPGRYGGLGCRKAVLGIDTELNDALSNRALASQEQLDTALLELDGTEKRSRLGANAILAVSLAFARATAAERDLPLYAHLAELIGLSPRTLPRPEINLFSGGRHGGGQVVLQDVLAVPTEARTIDEALVTMFDLYRTAVSLVLARYGMRELTADEGGLAPSFPDVEQMLADATEVASERPVALSIDVAASQFYDNGRYLLPEGALSANAMIEQLLDWIARYPIVAVEDGLAEDDWEAWTAFRVGAADEVLVVGDDLLCTNPARIRRAVEEAAADALLLKPNQVGTLTQAAEAHSLARAAGWRVIASARSGETEDDWLADLAVGWGADLIKIGSIRQSERLAKYNRLLAIERETHLPLAGL